MADPLPTTTALVVAVGVHGRIVAVWTDAEQVAGLAPSLSEPTTLHELPLTASPQIGQPLP
ncbi:hypothetical protein [Variovorax sp. V15]|uniref:hypothetical protein n=1 Tax=Variovorax sp. V15 TaxID=3065952 RepID=UPI0034E8E828